MSKASQKPSIRILQALICDAVRREFNGKEILIGVYGHQMILSELPATLFLTFWMRVRLPITKPLETEFRVVGDHDQQLVQTVKVILPVPARPEVPAAIVLEGVPIQIQSPGRIALQWKHSGGGWSTIVDLDITKGQIPTAENSVTVRPTVS